MSDEKDDSVKNMMEVFDAQIKMQGVGVVTVADGTMLMMTADVLKVLLEKAEESPAKRALIFVKHTVPS